MKTAEEEIAELAKELRTMRGGVPLGAYLQMKMLVLILEILNDIRRSK